MPTVLQKLNPPQHPRRCGGAPDRIAGELNDFVLRDKIGASLAASADLDVFKIPVGHGLSFAGRTKPNGWQEVVDWGATIAFVPFDVSTSASGTFPTWLSN
jgi:hypothetical protein